MSVTELIANLSDADPAVRLAAAETLASDADDATVALDALITALDDDDPAVRFAAVQAIGAADPVVAESAIGWALESPDYRVAVAAKNLVAGTAKLRGPDATVWRDPSIGYGD